MVVLILYSPLLTLSIFVLYAYANIRPAKLAAVALLAQPVNVQYICL